MTDQAPDTTTAERLEVMDARLEHLTALTQRNAEAIEHLVQTVEANSQQVAANSQQIAAMSESIVGGFSQLDARLNRLALASERQEQNITRLVGIVERLLERNEA